MHKNGSFSPHPWDGKITTIRLYRQTFAGKEMGFVDYLSKHPSGEPVPVSLDDEKFIIASVNQISTLLDFDHLMPRYSWSQIRNKFSQQILAHDVTYCTTIGQSMDNMISQEIARPKRIANAAETLSKLLLNIPF